MFKEIKPEQISDNAIKLINKDWLLVSACTKSYDAEGKIITGRPNTMTASWGALGELWNKPVATIYLRPQRYTKELIDATDTFSLSVLSDKYRTAFNYCGSHSGQIQGIQARSSIHERNPVDKTGKARSVLPQALCTAV